MNETSYPYRQYFFLGIKLFLFMILFASLFFFAGEHPLKVLNILLETNVFDLAGFSSVAFYFGPLLLTGLAVLIPYQSNIFNIGAEGQLYLGAMAGLWWANQASILNLPRIVVLPTAFVLCATAGGLWAAILHALRKRGTHEVISSIMLNFIAMALCNFFVLYLFKNPETQASETIWIPEAFRLQFSETTWGSRVQYFNTITMGPPIALAVALTAIYFVKKSWWGYRVKAMGMNAKASTLAGMNSNHTLGTAIFSAGACAGLVGFIEVYAHSYRLIDGFSPQYGFTGIAIALLAGSSFSRLIFATFLFAFLHKGALDLEIETDFITRDITFIIQSILLVALSLSWKVRHDD